MRTVHAKTVNETQLHLKEQNRVRKLIKDSLGNEAKSIPDLAAEIACEPEKILWHITAMKKYNEIVEAGKSGEYYLYALAKEAIQ